MTSICTCRQCAEAICEKCAGPLLTSPITELADALERADWSGVSIGNKVMLKGAIDALRGVAQVAPSDPEETGNFWCRTCNGTGRAPPSAALVCRRDDLKPRGQS